MKKNQKKVTFLDKTQVHTNKFAATMTSFGKFKEKEKPT